MSRFGTLTVDLSVQHEQLFFFFFERTWTTIWWTQLAIFFFNTDPIKETAKSLHLHLAFAINCILCWIVRTFCFFDVTTYGSRSRARQFLVQYFPCTINWRQNISRISKLCNKFWFDAEYFSLIFLEGMYNKCIRSRSLVH